MNSRSTWSKVTQQPLAIWSNEKLKQRKTEKHQNTVSQTWRGHTGGGQKWQEKSHTYDFTKTKTKTKFQGCITKCRGNLLPIEKKRKANQAADYFWKDQTQNQENQTLKSRLRTRNLGQEETLKSLTRNQKTTLSKVSRLRVRTSKWIWDNKKISKFDSESGKTTLKYAITC